MSTPSEDSCTRSLLMSKLDNLGKMTANFKRQLDGRHEMSEPRTRAEPKDPTIEVATSLEQLTSDMKRQMERLRTMQFEPSDQDNTNLVDMDLTPAVSLNSTDFADVLENSRASRNLDSVLSGIRQTTLQDLGTIDWSGVLGGRDNPESRMRPEGGSPMDEIVIPTRQHNTLKK